MKIELFNTQMQLVKEIMNSNDLKEGAFKISVDTKNIHGGIYFLKTELNGKIQIEKIICMN